MNSSKLSIVYADADSLILQTAFKDRLGEARWCDVATGSPRFIADVVEEIDLLQSDWALYSRWLLQGRKLQVHRYRVVASQTLRKPLPQKISIDYCSYRVYGNCYRWMIAHNQFSVDWMIEQVMMLDIMVWGKFGIGKRVYLSNGKDAESIFRKVKIELSKDLA